jgi:hypothetical protein
MVSRMGKCAAVLTLAVAALAVARPASAAAYLQLDVNSASVQARNGAGAPAFSGTGHTGDLTFTADATCTLAGVQYDGVPQPTVHVPVDVTGVIHLTGGIVQAGSTVSLHFGTAPNDNTYVFPLLADGGQLLFQTNVPAPTFKLIADMGTATFANANPVGGVDITPWLSATDGSFTLDHFAPDGQGFSNDVNLETLVPEPASLGSLGVAGLSLLARRRRSA